MISYSEVLLLGMVGGAFAVTVGLLMPLFRKDMLLQTIIDILIIIMIVLVVAMIGYIILQCAIAASH